MYNPMKDGIKMRVIIPISNKFVHLTGRLI